ncbi:MULTISPECIES: DUF4136 domain-containing protein [Flavobacterium]|jgi:hypothetical protein|uniref:DUF4136 domain-containing protein n=1 Tax=Flavobacterium TaxID=237 RepID=UPI0006FAF4B2|nr:MULTISPECIES: DUF4136 domain-containing protein [Flavobacterium]MBU7570391.1 DUF4136 domain-containing protein [Flavobacterium sp.]PZO32744.1 MAG: DUF4136 domain-containing protein [Flavobacteriaceae bacterium]PZQ85334.1 MAG: DUF4136 domain-containing protein [Flavobacterium johnsoniae]KQS47206.1 hypothetical protein ASG38_07030 [Flavobacterium sp. Leaf359]MDQ7960048.1 DUF4136 domain-containing protein [Flavobacterium lindanitolerans]
MKTIKLLPLLFLFALVSCSSVQVATDYDKNVDFANYKSFAFFKSGIDKVEISDLDKRRILNAIDAELTAKGITKSENPDLLVNIFTKSRQQVDVNQFNAGWGYGWGWGWNPWMWGGRSTTVSTTTEGTLYIDLIDARKKELIWQGEGVGVLTQNINKKDERIKEFVKKILEKYPPGKK